MAKEFLDLVRRSRLVEEDQLQRFLSEWNAREAEPSEDSAGQGAGSAVARSDASSPSSANLADALVQAQLITSWQADKLLAGKHKGFMLGKYKLLQHLGKGGMSQVYLAEHTLMKRKVAIKVLPKNRVEDSTYLERFRIEARAAAKLDDPNIVRAYDIDHEGDTHYIVMEYVEGQNLHELVRDQGPLSYETAADYIAQVARGLSHAHEMGLIHRDIKPANCLVDKHQTVKLLDMGLARLIDDEASLTLDNNENVLGTADYLAPEQALNSHKADARADIYSLGCTLYYLLTGHPPFPEGTISERLLKHQVEQPASIFKDRPDASPMLVNICNRMMAKKPDERYQTANDVVQRIADWLADRGHEVGESATKRSVGSGGVGSDVFRRFAASLSRGSADAAGRSDKKLPATNAQAVATVPEEEIGLAPLDDDAPVERKPPKKTTTQKSELDRAAAETVSAATSDTDRPAPPTPRRSLFEEELEKEQKTTARIEPRPSQNQPFDPLRPPGFSGPQYGTPAWVYILVGSILIAAMAGVLAIVFALVQR